MIASALQRIAAANVAVVFVRQRESGNQPLVAGDQRIPDMRVHETPGSLQGFTTEVGPALQQIRDPLIVYRVCPSSREDVMQRQLREQVAQWSGIEYARIKNDRKRLHQSIAHVEFLCLGHQ